MMMLRIQQQQQQYGCYLQWFRLLISLTLIVVVTIANTQNSEKLAAVTTSSSLSSGTGPPPTNRILSFSTERTSVSGFGARVKKKTIFSSKNTKTKSTKESPRLWVQRTRDPDVLWIKTRDDSSNDGNNDKELVTTTSTLRISISEETGDWQVNDVTASTKTDLKLQPNSKEWIPIEGLYGIYRLPSGIVWVLVTKTEPIFTAPSLFNNNNDNENWWQIRKVSNLELVHLGRPSTLLSPLHLKEEVRQLRLLRKSLKQHELYFVPDTSHTITDMTKNLQQSLNTSHHQLSSSSSSSSWWQSQDHIPDPRFFWNQASVEPLLERYEANKNDNDNDQEEQRHDMLLEEADDNSIITQKQNAVEKLLENVIPVASAFIGIQSNLTVGKDESKLKYHQILISRRSRFRAGTRFTKRGADASGAVANYVETEQVCLVVNDNDNDKQNTNSNKGETLQQVLSHVQTRGSIPLRWSSPTDIKTYRPRVRIGTDPMAQARALRLHLLEQYQYYVSNDDPTRSPNVAQIIFVNLIDKKSDQGRLGRAFDSVLEALMDVYNKESDADDDIISSPSSTATTATTTTTTTEEVSSSDSQTDGEDDSTSRSDINTASQESDSHGNVQSSLQSGSVEHIWFDFHAEVKNGKWDKLSVLLKELRPSLMDHGYLHAIAPSSTTNNEWMIQRRQNAVVRTNCMDCLDRTNVVQSIIGRFLLFQQLLAIAGHKVKVHDDEEDGDTTSTDVTTEDTATKKSKKKSPWAVFSSSFRKNTLELPWSDGELAHRLLWADNADAISRLYAGTAALKGDFTRTGKRTKKGALDDGMNSLQRYYLNNFLDADRQEGMDLMVGFARFSNVGDDPEKDSSSTTDDDDSLNYMTIKEAARRSILGDLLNGLSDKRRDDVKNRFVENDVIDSSNISRQLDLRWVPGDLQCHLRSQAALEDDNIKNKVAGSDVKPRHYAYSSSAALAEIDRRAASDLPWWVLVSDSSSGTESEISDDKEKDDDDDSDTTAPISTSPTVNASLILGVLVLGLRAPTVLASAAVGVQSLLLLLEKKDKESDL